MEFLRLQVLGTGAAEGPLEGGSNAQDEIAVPDAT